MLWNTETFWQFRQLVPVHLTSDWTQH